jgi:hypothetical protein
MIGGPVWPEWLVIFMAGVAIASYSIEKVLTLAVKVWERKVAAEYDVADRRLALDREIFERVHPAKVAEQQQKRQVVVPPDIEAQLADAPEWEREDTRARAIELYEVMERVRPDDKPQDRWGRVHKLLELETEAVQASV